jgi:hypothetical protein
MTRRPKPHDPIVLENIAGRLFPSVRDWLETQGEIFNAHSEQGLFDELVDLLHQNLGRWDGYDLARELEERSWSPNAELVAILQDTDSLAYHSLREEIVRWASDTNTLVPLHKVGDNVEVKLYSNEPSMIGQIVEVHPTLEYSVKLDSGTTLLVPVESVLCGGGQ